MSRTKAATIQELRRDLVIRGLPGYSAYPLFTTSDKLEQERWVIAMRGSPLDHMVGRAGLPTRIIEDEMDRIAVPKWANDAVQLLWQRESWNLVELDDAYGDAYDRRERLIIDLIRGGEDNPKLQAYLAAAALGLP